MKILLGFIFVVSLLLVSKPAFSTETYENILKEKEKLEQIRKIEENISKRLDNLVQKLAIKKEKKQYFCHCN